MLTIGGESLSRKNKREDIIFYIYSYVICTFIYAFSFGLDHHYVTPSPKGMICLGVGLGIRLALSRVHITPARIQSKYGLGSWVHGPIKLSCTSTLQTHETTDKKQKLKGNAMHNYGCICKELATSLGLITWLVYIILMKQLSLLPVIGAHWSILSLFFILLNPSIAWRSISKKNMHIQFPSDSNVGLIVACILNCKLSASGHPGLVAYLSFGASGRGFDFIMLHPWS